MVVKNLRPRPVELQVWMDGVLYPVTINSRGWYEVPEEAWIKNLEVLKIARDVTVLRIPTIKGLNKISDI